MTGEPTIRICSAHLRTYFSTSSYCRQWSISVPIDSCREVTLRRRGVVQAGGFIRFAHNDDHPGDIRYVWIEEAEGGTDETL